MRTVTDTSRDILATRKVWTTGFIGAALFGVFLGAGCGNGATGGDDAGAPVDAAPIADLKKSRDMARQVKPASLDCVGPDAGAPAAVPAMLTVSGKLANPLNKGMDVSGALIEARLRVDNSVVVSQMTPADGTFSIKLTTNGQPWDGYVKITKDADTTVVPLYVYPAAPLRADITNATVPLLRKTDRDVFTNVAMVTPMAGKSMLFAVVQDCAQSAVEGATVQITPAPERIVYFTAAGGAVIPNPSATDTATDGVAVGFNASGDAKGNATVSATWMGTSFRSNTVGAWPDSLVVVFVAPR